MGDIVTPGLRQKSKLGCGALIPARDAETADLEFKDSLVYTLYI